MAFIHPISGQVDLTISKPGAQVSPKKDISVPWIAVAEKIAGTQCYTPVI